MVERTVNCTGKENINIAGDVNVVDLTKNDEGIQSMDEIDLLDEPQSLQEECFDNEKVCIKGFSLCMFRPAGNLYN